MKSNGLLITILFFAVLSYNFQCGKEDPIPGSTREVTNLEMALDIYPVKKKYTLGDTIWIEANQPDKKLTDLKSDTQIPIEAAQFNIPFMFHVLNKQVLVPGGGFCQFIGPETLEIVTSNGYFDSRYNVYWNYNTGTIQKFGCDRGEYKFKIGIKLKAKGIFYIGLGASRIENCGLNNENLYQDTYLSFRFNEQDVNTDIYNESPKLPETDPYRIGFDTNLLRDKRAFVVQVD